MGESIGTQILNVQQLLHKLGYQSDIFCEQAPIHFEKPVFTLAEYPNRARSTDILLVHFALGLSESTLNWLQQVPARKILIYHNITPAHYFRNVNLAFEEAAQRGRAQLKSIKPWFEGAWADSAFNGQELRALGWPMLGVLPIIFNPARIKKAPDAKVRKQYQTGETILFVGRISPNKRIEDLITSFYYLKQHRPQTRLILVGSAGGTDSYLAYLQALITQLNLADVIFTGHVTQAQWAAYYHCAKVYLSLSEHEGFCIPLLESMYFGLPIVAYESTAVPETLGPSGLLITQKDPRRIAALLALLLDNPALRATLVVAQRQRLTHFLPQTVEALLQNLLKPLVNPKSA